MRSGPLRHIGTLQRRTTDGDVEAAPDAWHDVCRVRFSIDPIKQEELPDHVLSTHRLTMRYIASVTPDMRIATKDTVYEIASVRDLHGRHRTLSLLVMES